MNSEKKLYEELLQEHPELKESEVDIMEVITLMKKMNPDITPDQDYKNALKQRLDAIVNYNPQKSHSFIWFLKYVIPVFSFGFAVFWFVYFSDEFKADTIDETPKIAAASMMMSTEDSNEPQLKTRNLSSDSRMLLEGEENTNNQENLGWENTSEDMWDNVLDEMMSMMFSMDEVMEDSPENININESEEWHEMRIMSMDTQEFIQDLFADICWEHNWLLQILEDGERVCILEEKNCYETTYEAEECFHIK